MNKKQLNNKKYIHIYFIQKKMKNLKVKRMY